jgi:hypothetical protein
MRRTAHFVLAAAVAAVIGGWFVLAWRTAHCGNAPRWDAPPPEDADDLAYRLVSGAYHHHDWDSPAPGEAGPLFPRQLARLAFKERVARDVFAGRISLLQAATIFRERDRREANRTPQIDSAGGDRPVEHYCRSVIWWVRYTVPEDQADQVARRLEEDLDARLRDGPLELPARTAE